MFTCEQIFSSAVMSPTVQLIIVLLDSVSLFCHVKFLRFCMAIIDNISLLPHVNTVTRGNKYKLYQSSVKYDIRKHFFY